MRHPVIWTVLGAAVVIVPTLASKAAPAVRARCSQACERMLAKMPESFPPNRMLADVAALKEQTARLVDLMERGRDPAPAIDAG